MPSAPLSSDTSRPLAAAVGAFLLTALIAAGVLWQSLQHQQQEERLRVSALAKDQARTLELNIERALSATYTLAAMVRQGNGKITNFEAVAGEMLQFYPGVAGLELSPGGIIQHVVPLAGNEKALGFDQLRDPVQSREALIARDRGRLTLAGPMQLVQGGMGAVGRLPVFLDDASGKPYFWGFTNVVIRFPDILLLSRLANLIDHGVDYELWHLRRDNGKKEIIAASSGNVLIDPAEQHLGLAHGDWILSAAPVDGWVDSREIWLKAGLVLFISWLMGYLAMLLAKQRLHKTELEQKVNERTQDLAGRELLLRQILDTSSVGIFLIDVQGRITQVNQRMAEMFGIPVEKLIGEEYIALVHPSEREKGRQTMLDLLASDIPSVDLDRLYWRADQTEFWGRLTGRRFYGTSGERLGIIGVIADITERKKDQEKSQRLMLEMETILRNAMVGIAYLKQRRIVSCNRRLENIFGYEPGELIGETTEKLYDTHETFLGVGQRAYADLDKNNNYNEELMLKRKDGSLFFGALTGCAIDPGRPHEGSIWIYADISARRQAELALEESRERFDLAVRGSLDGIWDWNIETGKIYVSDRWCEMLGYRPGEVSFTSKGWADWIHPEDREPALEQMRQHFRTRKPYASEYRMPTKNGDYRWFLNRGQAIWNAQGRAIRVAGSTTDITDRKQAEEALRIAATAFESQEGMTITDADGIILRINKAFTRITGYAEEEIVGRNPRLLNSGRQNSAFYKEMWESLQRSGSWQGEIWNRRKNGEVYPEWLSITAVKDGAGKITHYVGTFSDITARKLAEEEINNLAFYDPLTRLPNRRLLLDRLNQALASAVRNERYGALLFIDLDNFKTLNDTRGHDVGDVLLQQVAQRLAATVREGDTVARLGGDEFVVMLEDLSENPREAATQSESVGEKILASLNQSYQLVNSTYRSTPSIGITLFSGQKGNIDELLKRADLAMYQAKAAGRNTLRFFDPEMQAIVTERVALEASLSDAVQKNQFILHYQAQVVGNGRLTGVEVLLRWPHPERGMVSPAEFIPLAEDTGLILPLGHWVLQTACGQLAKWATRPEMAHLTIAVNVSVRQFKLPNFVDIVLAVLAETGANPQRLKLELTESLLVENVEDIIAKMSELKAKGVGFSLDDFGTGYSSLSYLKRLPLDQLKIDQGFVRDILTDHNDASIAKMIVALAESMGLSVIAEGVEIEAQRDFLSRHGCHAYQGYYFSRPLPLDEFEVYAARG